MGMNEEHTTLATEILKELRASARRWFIAFLVMMGIEVATIGGFLWYLSLPAEEGVIVENDDGNANYVGGDIGGDLNNGTNNRIQETEQETA